MRRVRHLKVEKGLKVSTLVDGMKDVGFGANKIGEASEIMLDMFKDKSCKVFLGVAGAMVPGGMRNVILDLLDDVDIFVTTGATLTHDLVEALGDYHFIGNENGSDEDYNKKGFDRMYNILMPNKVYEKLEDFFEKNFDEFRGCKSIKDFTEKLGELVKGTNSLLAKCYEKRIPIFCPGIADSGIGLMVWGRLAKGKNLDIGVFNDLNDIIDFSWTAKKTGVIYVGGGLPKNFIQQSLQFSKGADYGIQITTDRAEPGGSSGASLKEGISWGKLKPEARFVDVFCDATIALPLVYGAVKDKI